MTQVSSVGRPTQIGEALRGEAEAPAALQSPLMEVSDTGDTGDALVQLMTALVRLSDLSISESEVKVALNTKQIQTRYQDYLKRVAEARKEAKEDGGGIFGSIAKKLADLLADTVGGALDFMDEVSGAQLEVTLKLLPDDIDFFLRALTDELGELSSEWRESIDGFVEGTIRFSCDVAAFSVAATGGIAAALIEGQPLDEAALGEAKALLHSARTNLLENEDFMEVVSVLGKSAAMAAAVGSGGALAPVALGVLLAISELDSRYQILDELGDAAPYVRIGVSAATVTVGLMAGGADTAKVVSYLNAAVGIVSGAATMNAGARALQAAANRRAEAEQAIAIKQALQRVAQLQRLQDDLIIAYQEHVKAKNGVLESSARLFEIRAESYSASVLRA